jgi:hypothetical protein
MIQVVDDGRDVLLSTGTRSPAHAVVTTLIQFFVRRLAKIISPLCVCLWRAVCNTRTLVKHRHLAIFAALFTSCMHEQPAGVSAPPQLLFSVAPHDVMIGDAIDVEVTVRSQTQGVQQNHVDTVTIALGQHPESAQLYGSTALPAVNGVADGTPAELYLFEPGQYTLTASVGTSTIESAPFFARPLPPRPPGPPTGSLQIMPPYNFGPVTGPNYPPVKVATRDTLGVLLSVDSVAVSLTVVGIPTGSLLAGPFVRNTVRGIADFSDVRFEPPCDFKLIVTAIRFAEASAPVSVGASPSACTAQPPPPPPPPGGPGYGTPKKLIFYYQPSSTPAGTRIVAPIHINQESGPDVNAVGVLVVDSADHEVYGPIPITLTLGSHPAGATLSGTLTAGGGIAAFLDLRIDTPGSGYTLVARSPGLDSAVSTPFDIYPPNPAGAARVIFTGYIPDLSPENYPVVRAGTPLPTVEVTAFDDSWVSYGLESIAGEVAPNYTGPVTLTLIDPAAVGATLSGTTTVNAVNGIAHFSNIVVDRAGNYKLRAGAPDLAGDLSNTFNILAP